MDYKTGPYILVKININSNFSFSYMSLARYSKNSWH